MVAQNNLLRDQLEESHQLNEALTGDLQKLTNDWEALRDEMCLKEDEWKDEEQVGLIFLVGEITWHQPVIRGKWKDIRVDQGKKSE